MLKITIFDEVDEATAILKAARRRNDAPAADGDEDAKIRQW